MSVHAHLFGVFEYNMMPLAPMGCDVQIHEYADNRGSWSPRVVDGWYLGTLPDHYRSHIIHVTGTKANRVLETVCFKHKYLTNPTVTDADKVVDAASALCEALRKRKQGMSNGTMDALRNLSDIFLDRSPARNTRLRCSTIAALTLLSNSQASGAQWRPRNMNVSDFPMTPFAELASAVLEGDSILKYRQLLRHPILGPAWNTSSSNECGRLAQGVGGRVKGTDTFFHRQRRRAIGQSNGCNICPVCVQHSTRKRG